MPSGISDAVRAYQLPDTAPGQPNLSPSTMTPNTPVYITPGFGGSSSGFQLPPINTGAAHYDIIITYYMDQAAVERREV